MTATSALLALTCTLAMAADQAPAVTSLEAGPYRRADAVVLAVVTDVTDVRAPGGALGRQVARARIERSFKGGLEPQREISIVVNGQRPTLDPARPSVPYFTAGEPTRFVLFLGTPNDGTTWHLQTLFDTGDKAGPAKVAAVAAVAEMAAIGDARAKARKAIDMLTEMLAARSGWTRTHAARELAWLARVRPSAFDVPARSALRRLPSGRMTPDQRFWMRELFKTLAAHTPAPGQPQAPAREEQDPWRRAFLETTDATERQLLVDRLLREAGGLDRHGWWAYARLEPSLRGWFLGRLADGGVGVSTRHVRALYAGEEAPETRAAIVRAVGLLGNGDDVAWLAARTRNRLLRRPACLALARIRTSEATAFLRALGRDVREEDAELAAWISHLLSPAFVKAERRAGRDAGYR